MPSGSRRRKAAKKKKGNDPNNIKSSSTLSTENDDLRNQEERDSDGGENEVVSPVSEGNNHDQFPEGANESEKRDDPPPVRSVAFESISLEGDTVGSKEVQIVGLDSEANGILEEDVKEMNPEDVPESGSVDVVCDESVEILTNGYHEEHSVVDLNGEPRFDVESDLVKPESAILEAPDSGDSIFDSVFTAFEKVIHDVTEVALPETSVDSGLGLNENGEKELKPREYSSEIAPNVLDVSSEVEEDVESDLVKPESAILEAPDSGDSVVDSLFTAFEKDVESDLVKPESAILEAPDSGNSIVDSVFEKVIHDVTEVALPETSVDSGLDFKENGDKELKPRDYSSEIAQNVLDVSSEVEEDVESVAAVSEEVVHLTEPVPDEPILDSGSALKESEEKELQTRDYSSQVPQTPLDISSNAEEYNISSESVPVVESFLDKAESIPLVSEKVIHVPETVPIESTIDSWSDLKEHGEEVIVPVESSIGFDKAAISDKLINVNGTARTKNVDRELLTGDSSAQTPDALLDISSKVEEPAAKLSSIAAKAIEKEDTLPISDSSTLRASSSVESSKEPESCEISENQPLIATATRQVEKTSWFGCCGLFDLISGTR